MIILKKRIYHRQLICKAKKKVFYLFKLNLKNENFNCFGNSHRNQSTA